MRRPGPSTQKRSRDEGEEQDKETHVCLSPRRMPSSIRVHEAIVRISRSFVFPCAP